MRIIKILVGFVVLFAGVLTLLPVLQGLNATPGGNATPFQIGEMAGSILVPVLLLTTGGYLVINTMFRKAK
ncbi:MAG: hypothetical protein ACFCU1_12210 [Sumerlaeia bacterium]